MPLTALKSPDAAARWLRSWVTGTITTASAGQWPSARAKPQNVINAPVYEGCRSRR